MKKVEQGLSSFDSDKGVGKKTPEIYFGYHFSRNQFGQNWEPGEQIKYTIPNTLEIDKFYLNGTFEKIVGGDFVAQEIRVVQKQLLKK